LAFLEPLGRVITWLLGWRVEGAVPPELDKFIIIVAPHTSNWDYVVGLPCAFALKLVTQWPYGVMAKNSVFRGPVGVIMRTFGGIPIDRSARHNLVEQMVEVFGQRERLMLVITPEGTRKKTDHWKSGFYRIARGADVPVVMAALDFGPRVARLSQPFMLSGDVDKDLAVIRQFYSGVTAKHPEKFSDIRFRD
jgi:1-acyl-sn-glycerol-3-phosphate acyltransferase